MKASRYLLAATVAAIVVAGCESGGNRVAPTEPSFGISTSIGPITHVSVCLYGASAGFNYNQPATLTAPAQSGSFSLVDNECEVETDHADNTGPTDVTVTETVPAGFVVDSITAENTYTHAIVKVVNTNTITVRVTNDIGQILRFYNHELHLGVIGDFVWDDVNGNGVQDAGEPGIPNQTVSITGPNGYTSATITDANGFYQFTGLYKGDYTVTVATPTGYTATGSNLGGDPTKDSNGSPASVNLPAYNSTDNTIDFGFTHIPVGQIGDFVWHDENGNGIQDPTEPGIAGATVTLTGPGGTQTTTTNGVGAYLFSGLGAGTYTVTVTTPFGYSPSPSNQGGDPTKDSNGSPATVTLAAWNSTDLTIDFGFVPNPAGSIGDYVWNDKNGNGIQENGEPGIPGMTVTLTGPGGTQTTTTDGNGGYSFTGLGAGTYQVSLTCPAGYAPSPSGQGGDPAMDSNGSPASVTLASYNSSDNTIDFGCVAIPVGKIGDFVWNDLNNNGIQDAGEPGIQGVSVVLSGAANATTTTDANGFYQFTGLNAGNYTVTVTMPSGFSASPSLQGGDTNKDSNGSPTNVSLPSYNSVDNSVDFGFVEIKAGEIGDFVWNDKNGNGIQDAGEPGLTGVTVTLSGPVNTTTLTDGSGNYLFTGLPAGTYTVSVTCPNGFAPTLTGQGTTSTDNNGSPASVNLPTNTTTNTTIDFGCYEIPAGQIGDFVWKDLNGNGIQDAGEPGIGGLTVTLTGPVTATTVTNGFGAYLFTNLPSGNYTVSVATPAGYTASPTGQGTVATDNNGSPASVNLPTYTSSNLTIDFGFVPPAPPTGQIGDYVWEDEDGDGKQDPSEPGMSGITVTLSGPVNATTTTDGNGAYLFSNLPAGTYTVTVGTPTGFTASPSNQGGDPTKDSNGSPATVTLATNSSTDLTIDFGFVPPQGIGRITGGGAQITAGNVRVSRGFTLHCDITLSNNLEINWPGTGNGASSENNFHITRPLRSAQCILDPKYRQPPPAAPFNTFIGVADGTLNGVPGALVRFTFIDAGEPGRNDKAQIQVYAPNGQLVLNVPLSYLNNGNIQAHYDQPHGSNVNGPVGGGK